MKNDEETEKSVAEVTENKKKQEENVVEEYQTTDNIQKFVKGVESNLNVRSMPKHESALVETIERDDELLVYTGINEQGLGSDGIMHTWYQIVTESGNYGWVRSDLVIVKP